MEAKVIVMIVTLAMPNGQGGVHLRKMATVEACRSAVEIEISDPFVASAQCSELVNGRLQPSTKRRARKIPETSNFKSTG